MAKDPAFLFYTSDFLTGTYLMTDEQVGKYIRLLCLQHQTGRLTEQSMLKVCKEHDPTIWEKFEVDEQGLYYNQRLEEEANKRNSYCESRRKSREARTEKEDTLRTKNVRNNVRKPYVSHTNQRMEDVNENENTDVTVTRKRGSGGKGFTPPTLQEVADYCTKRSNSVDPQAWIDHYASNGWLVGKNPMKDWRASVRTWEKRNFDKPTQTRKPTNMGNFKQREYKDEDLAFLYEDITTVAEVVE